MPYIYKISNDINDKLYIGKTLYTIERRWSQHKNNARTRKDLEHLPLYSAMNKYGIEHFSIEAIEEVKDEKKLSEREQYWIKYTVTDKTNDRIVIGAEPNTTLIDFKDNMINPNEFIKIYDLDNNELLDDEVVKTGLIIKLEINGTVYDEAIMIVRGDIDGDGIIAVSDEAMLTDHILSISVIDDYRFYAADIEEDELLDVVDDSLITDYILGIIDSLNE